MNFLKKMKRNKFRELTNKERFLITLLAIVVLLYLSFKFIIDPQVERIETLQVQKNNYIHTIQDNNKILKERRLITEKHNDLLVEKEEIEEDYFSSLNQPEIIYMLNELLLDSGIEMSSISFSRPFYEEISEDESISKMDISIPYNGLFEDINRIIKMIKKEPRKIIVNNLSIGEDEETETSGSISLGIYSLEGIVDGTERADDVNTTDDNNSNPFLPYQSYIDENMIIENSDSNNEFVDDGIDDNDGRKEEEITDEAELEEDEEYRTYKAVRGDNITFISRAMYGSEKYVDEILKLNNMDRESILPIGKELKLIRR